MAEEKDWNTLMDDVKTIKSILQNEDAPLPRVWVAAWTAAPTILATGLVQYFVPFFRALDFDGKLLWLWLPAFCLVFPLALIFLYRELGRTGKRFLGQSRIRNLLYARFVVPPAALVLVWTASRNPVFSLEGIVLVVVSIWLTVVEQVLPDDFRPVPLSFLVLGLIELGFHLSGPETTLFNVALVAGTVAFAGYLFWRRERAARLNGEH